MENITIVEASARTAGVRDTPAIVEARNENSSIGQGEQCNQEESNTHSELGSEAAGKTIVV